ncbi:hypothetical protein GCU67_08365 [Modestobacter muralis]|uniref:Uncharacterized protein n=1 Tax=Modestobacter muralis TaxID=1608614 RepID=A0A6P0EU98_9ACTN|nr:hypothetical protein [Modestobacter muralis]NEK94186.1 hypothetical protein [Modestobacter muralis]NEN50954.1 hypothetical protein [Modestobacter muralis]
MADKNRVPRPLGWCSACLADDQREHPAVTSHQGTSLCREHNAAAHREQQASLRLGDLAAQAQTQAEAAVEEARKILARAWHLRDQR